ncbi:MAG TPA: HAD family acid phosphatase [Rudaea sp.]|jgi:acid phosphatase
MFPYASSDNRVFAFFRHGATNPLRALRTPLLLALFLLQACAATQTRSDATPANLGEVKAALRTYHDRRYQAEIEAVAARASTYLLAHAGGAVKPALVLDIDETSISNWEQMMADDFGYFTDGPCDNLPKGPCGAIAWNATGRATAIAPTLRLFHTARENNIPVYFVTGRYEKERDATVRNLTRAGYADWAGIYMRKDGTPVGSTAEFKASQRAAIEAQGVTIVVNMGDQPSDLAGGHAVQGFLLPNPFYRIP